MPVALGAGVGLVDVLVFASMLAIAVILWTTLQLRAPAGRLPVVGGTLINAIDSVRQAVTQIALGMEQFFAAQQAQVSSLWTRFILQVLNPTIAGFQNAIVSVGLRVEDIATRRLSALENTVAGLSGTVLTLLVPLVDQHTHRITSIETDTRDVIHPTIEDLSHKATTTAQLLENAIGRVGTLEHDLAAAVAVLGTLAPFLPILRGLAAFETASAGGLTALGGELTLQRGRVQVLENDLSKVLALAGVTALGAVAIQNLIRVARDPCKGCPGADLTNYEARLFQLEMFGQE